jgi:hypothetical protein
MDKRSTGGGLEVEVLRSSNGFNVTLLWLHVTVLVKTLGQVVMGSSTEGSGDQLRW